MSYAAAGDDETKDQSYFLARLSQQQLAQVEFPLGEIAKEKVYNFVETLSSRSAAHSGEIVSTDGQVLGCHNGIYNYTIVVEY